jgi:hypothetical protein
MTKTRGKLGDDTRLQYPPDKVNILIVDYIKKMLK